MPTNLFGPKSKDDIRVGYISTDTGYVTGVTICEANYYAQQNPGTTFIFRNGDNNIKYLNINDVNKLTPESLVSTANSCGGPQTIVECGVPTIDFSGGGGIGALGNAVVGIDGAILAVDVIEGGFGYQYEPFVSAKDNCQIGNGAVLTAVLGESTETLETYDNEADFEEYEICPDTTPGYGRNWGPNGEDLGPWNPKTYTEVTEDPIQKEIEEYQKAITLGKNPFWTTRKNTPKRIRSLSQSFRKYDVTDEPYLNNRIAEGAKNPVAWNEFMNSYAVSPVSPSNVPGTDFAGRVFTFEWEDEFPRDGEYIFRGLCDNKATLYLDGLKFFDLGNFNEAVNPQRKTLQAGVHKIRVDLENFPIYETITNQPAASKTVDVDFNISVAGGFPNKFEIPDLGISVSKVNDRGQSSKKENFTKNVEYGKVYKVKLSTGNRGKIKLRTQGDNVLQAEDDRDFNWKDIECATSIGRFYDLNEDECKFIVGEPKPPAPTLTQSSAIQTKKVFNTIDYIDKANRRLWRTNVFGNGGFLNDYGICPFDTTVQLEDNPYAGTHTIVWNNINFPVDGDYRIQIAVDDNVTLYIGDTQIRKEGFFQGTSTGTGDLNEIYQFKAGNYTIRAELEQIPGGKFGFGAIKGINPMALAVNIETTYTTEQVVSSKSWNDNPMGISITIDAPPPIVPKEVLPVQTGRCPPSPIWSTRFPGASQAWYPVRFNVPNTWSKFMNRYALSPVPPLDTPGSDQTEVNFLNDWNVEIPYAGYYGVKGTGDNRGRLLIDDIEVAQLDGFKNANPKLTKVYLTKGNHKITTEIFNDAILSTSIVNQKIFNTNDWIVPSPPAPKTVDVDFNISVAGGFANKFVIDDLGISVSKVNDRGQSSKKENVIKNVEFGRAYKVKLSTSNQGQIKLRTQGNNVLQVEDDRDFNWKDIECSVSVGRFYDLKGDECKFIVDSLNIFPTTNSGTVKDGVTYSGPQLASYASNTISPAYFDGTGQEIMDKTFTMRWSNVNFPEDGQYIVKALADDEVIVRVDGVEAGRARVFQGVKTTFLNVTKGKRTVELELTNIPGNPQSTFQTNPVVTFVEISKNINVTTKANIPWTTNPVGVSAILIPPPCPKLVRGRGVVDKVIVEDPGVGYIAPAPTGQGYPVILKLAEVLVENSGINYNCGVDRLTINGIETSYTCSTFGRIETVNVPPDLPSFNSYPEIILSTETGVNASFTPVFEVVRDPIVADIQKLIQVTDLVGLKQTGYVDGRAYYGAVFYENGVRYAGYYKTIGTPIRIYDTLQESITAQVTTPASAIERSGTDVTSNDPRLNIPGTPNTTT
jgi:hypothetical protein